MLINLTPHALLFTIASIGVSEASYLIRKRVAAERPVCPIGGGCETVLNSRYNRLLLIHNDILGILFYIASAIVTALIVISDSSSSIFVGTIAANLQRLLLIALEAMLAGATIMSAIFTYLQWKVIKAWCFWCVMSAITIGIMDVIVMTINI